MICHLFISRLIFLMPLGHVIWCIACRNRYILSLSRSTAVAPTGSESRVGRCHPFQKASPVEQQPKMQEIVRVWQQEWTSWQRIQRGRPLDGRSGVGHKSFGCHMVSQQIPEPGSAQTLGNQNQRIWQMTNVTYYHIGWSKKYMLTSWSWCLVHISTWNPTWFSANMPNTGRKVTSGVEPVALGSCHGSHKSAHSDATFLQISRVSLQVTGIAHW